MQVTYNSLSRLKARFAWPFFSLCRATGLEALRWALQRALSANLATKASWVPLYNRARERGAQAL